MIKTYKLKKDKLVVKFPTTVKVLHKTYDLVERTDPTEIMAKGNYGNHHEAELRIEYLEHKSNSETVDTVIHEILHALIGIFRLKKHISDDENSEEDLVSTLSTGLTTVFKDNPELVEVIRAKLL